MASNGVDLHSNSLSATTPALKFGELGCPADSGHCPLTSLPFREIVRNYENDLHPLIVSEVVACGPANGSSALAAQNPAQYSDEFYQFGMLMGRRVSNFEIQRLNCKLKLCNHQWAA